MWPDLTTGVIIKLTVSSTCPQLSPDPQPVHIYQPATMSCINMKWKHLLKSKSKQKHTQDYIYLQWHYMTSPATPDDTAPYDIVRDNIEPVQEVAAKTENSKFSNIHTWLASQPENICTEIYCDCCDPDTDLHYSCVDVSRHSSLTSLTQSSSALTGSSSSLIKPSLIKSRRQDSISSITSSQSSASNNSNSTYCSLYNEQDEDIYYSFQLRQKSKSLFKHV